jgi:cob(I)alamin adenosyltransferase
LKITSIKSRVSEPLFKKCGKQVKNFILPGGNIAASYTHIARCVCRRTERLAVQLSENDFVDEKIIVYLNRLSDYLFVLARYILHLNKISEITWQPRI